MGEGRNEELKNSLGVKKIARVEAIIATITIMVLVIGMIVIMGCLNGGYTAFQIIVILILMVVVSIIVFMLVNEVLKEDVVNRLNKKCTEECLSKEEYRQVIPIKADEHKEFVLGLTDIATFYAIINKENDWVKIYIKFNNEDKLRYWESREKGYFLTYYSIQEDDKEEKEN